MTEVNPLDRLNQMVIYQTFGLNHRSRARLYIITRLAGLKDKLKSSKDLPPETVIQLLDHYFPDWQNPDGVPPEWSCAAVRKLAVEVTNQLVAILGTSEQWHAQLEAELEQRRAEKQARKAEARAAYAEQRRAKQEARQQRRERKVYEP